MQNKKLFRILAVIVMAALLFVPALLMTLAWGGSLNLEVTAVAIASSVAVAIWLPRVKWLVAVVAALLIAVPPFPYWTNWDESRGAVSTLLSRIPFGWRAGYQVWFCFCHCYAYFCSDVLGNRQAKIINGLARIDVSRPGVRTVSGASVGMSEDALKRLYHGRLTQQPHAYVEPDGLYLTLRSRGGEYGIRFETDGSVVTGFYAGTGTAIQYIEGCQ
ncbi:MULTISPECIES: hypothetical protein [Pseudoxanthomonas]|jgi:hypothetical protein|uniref:Uncharacterized protein n=1 Tax=Pseudoxanthomonas winnipegensis TaxID=2480810 RepID=A0A4Q8LD60_9GAMM|nr:MULTISPECIES: hypothetical protein [Pseudoxanthomonas]TAA26828.1 hypothetical protein EA660_06345 [Pseudoxanthomonas winnipegensis]TMN19483.1 hypothetical protein FF950_11365 [Pseudoxanthomonas sp. X-1]UAY75476.1 hypothetical protein LAJ50_04245 [Pseudoxanthomonas sp. X-1]